MITLGGNAELELVDSMDPFSKGIISASCHRRRVGKISQIFLAERRFVPLRLLFSLLTEMLHCRL